MPVSASPLLDLTQRVDTPEGCSLPLTPASPVQRSLAWLIDLLVRLAITITVANLADSMGQIGSGLMMLLLFLLNWWYMVLFEVLNNGRSPGKIAMKLRVVQLDGSTPDWGNALLRNLLRLIDMLPLMYSLGTAVALGNPRFQRLGDLVAGTMVIHEPRLQPRVPAPEVTPLPPLQTLSAEEQRAVLAFDERLQHLTEARKAELASLLQQPLDLDEHNPGQHLRQVASSLRGQP